MATAASVAIVGGGYAGMAAAVELAGRGVPVTVFEAGPVLGGRARRVNVHDTDLDNGLHILIGAYRETLRLIERVAPGRDALLRLPLDWQIHDRLRLRAPRLPAPLHLAWALITARGLSPGDKFAAARFLQSMKARDYRLAQDDTVEALLGEHLQPNVLIELLWGPLCIAALNTPPARASAQLFLHVLRDSLGADRAASDLLLARTDLSALFPEPAADFVRAHGGRVELNTPVDRITRDARGFALHVRVAPQYFDRVICAVAPHRAGPLLAELPELAGTARALDAFDYEPIHSVYLQYADTVPLPAPMLGFTDGPAQWLFDREALCGQRGLVGAVISASRAHVGEAQDALAQAVHEDLARRFGPLPVLTWQRVIAEKRATFSATPGLARPAVTTPCRHFYLAGDYTASDYPATLEAAVRSGLHSARILSATG